MTTNSIIMIGFLVVFVTNTVLFLCLRAWFVFYIRSTNATNRNIVTLNDNIMGTQVTIIKLLKERK